MSLLSSLEMDVFVIPVGRERYELYCEQPAETEAEPEPAPEGVFGKLRYRFTEMLRAAEERQRHGAPADEPKGWLGRVQDRVMAWVVERIAEQRLLWNLRRQTTAVAAHPQDMTFEQVMTLIRRTLQRDYERHRLWLVLDTLFLIASGALMLVPGPNLVAYYFAFRVVGHWLSMRGAAQGLHHVVWSGRPCPPLGELRDLAVLEPRARDQRIHDIAARLRLQHLSTFFERVTVRHAA
jgi:hypothetical protein